MLRNRRVAHRCARKILTPTTRKELRAMISDYRDLALIKKDVVEISCFTEEMPNLVDALGRQTEPLLSLTLRLLKSAQD